MVAAAAMARRPDDPAGYPRDLSQDFVERTDIEPLLPAMVAVAQHHLGEASRVTWAITARS
jgi:hypothetical protein